MEHESTDAQAKELLMCLDRQGRAVVKPEQKSTEAMAAPARNETEQERLKRLIDSANYTGVGKTVRLPDGSFEL